MTTVDVLRRAKAEMERRGFCQGDFTNEQGCCCLIGACWYALGASFRKQGRQWHVVRGAHDFPGEVVGLLDAATQAEAHEWNDADGRTQAEALAALDRAIALAETPGAPLDDDVNAAPSRGAAHYMPVLDKAGIEAAVKETGIDLDRLHARVKASLERAALRGTDDAGKTTVGAVQTPGDGVVGKLPGEGDDDECKRCRRRMTHGEREVCNECRSQEPGK